MAMLDTKEYGSWLEYFNDKFPPDKVIVDHENTETGTVIRVRSKVINCETRLVIEFPGEDACIINCTNSDSELVRVKKSPEVLNNILFETYYTFNDISLDQLDNQLNIPLYLGWTEELVFYKQKLVEAQVRFNDGVRWNSLPVEKNRSWLDSAGCLLTLFTWPVLYLQHQVVLMLYSKKVRKVVVREKVIGPMMA